MSISFKTDHQHLSSGAHKYTITVETDIKRYFESIQQVARDCVDDSHLVELLVLAVPRRRRGTDQLQGFDEHLVGSDHYALPRRILPRCCGYEV